MINQARNPEGLCVKMSHLYHEDSVRAHEPSIHDLPPGHAPLDHGVHLGRNRQYVLHLLQHK
jgi:hypothetical protein